jgi:hypothetical protein
MKFELALTGLVDIDEQSLKNIISNALFCEYSKNKKKMSEMTLYDLSTYLPDIIGDEVLKSFQSILDMNKN